MQDTADYAIIGGGVMGAGTAFHLAARGANNILLLEKRELFGTDSPWMGQIGKTAGDTIPIKSPESR